MIPAQHAAEAPASGAQETPQPSTAKPLTPEQLARQLENATAESVAEFNLEEWIGGVGRPEEDVLLHNPNPDWTTRYEQAAQTWRSCAARAALAKKQEEDGAERSITDLGAAGAEAEEEEALLALKALMDERDAAALRVRLQQRTPEEVAKAHARARADGIPPEFTVTYAVAEAIVSVHAPADRGGHQIPAFTGAQLYSLVTRDTTGFHQFVELRQTLDRISERPSVPSLPGSSTSRGTDGSSAR